MIARWRVAGRVARREVWRRPWRTVLIMLLVAAPIAATMCAVVMLRTEPSGLDQFRSFFGRADAVVQSQDPSMPAATLPAGSHTATLRRGLIVATTTDGRISRIPIQLAPFTDPITDGIVGAHTGTLPGAPDEILVGRNLASDWHLRVGDRIDLAKPVKTQLRVTGIGTLASGDDDFAVVSDRSPIVPPNTPIETMQLVQATSPQGMRDLSALSRQQVQLASDWHDPANDGRVSWARVWGAVALAVFSVVIGAAFAAGARRQMTTQGLLDANGAPRSTRRAALFLQGSVLGALGSTAGIAIGVFGTFAVASRIKNFSTHHFSLSRLQTSDFLLIGAFGVIAATIAALVPARSATRISPLRAITGGNIATPFRKRGTVLGAVAVAGGLALMGYSATLHGNPSHDTRIYLVTASALALIFGTCALMPGAVQLLGRVAHGMRGSTRFAVRSLVRHRGRTAASVAAIAVTSALAVGAATGLAATRSITEARPASRLVSVSASNTTAGRTVTDEVRRVLPAAQQHVVDVVVPPSPVGYDGVAVASPDTLSLYHLGSDARHALDQYGAITKVRKVLYPAGYTPVGDPTFGAHVVDMPAADSSVLPPTLVTREFARANNLQTSPAMTVFDNHRPISSVQRRGLDATLDESFAPIAGGAVTPVDVGTTISVMPLMVNYDSGHGGISEQALEELLAGVAALAALVVVGFTLALSAAENRDERNNLALVGASPRTLSGTTARRAFVLTLFGAAMAVPLGFVPVAELLWLHPGYEVHVPVVLIALLVGAVPIGAALLTRASSTIALAVRPVRVSARRDD